MMIGLRCSAATSMNDSKPVTGVRSAPVSEPGGSLVARKASDCIGPPTMLGEQAATAFGIESNGSGGRESLMPRSAADDERIAIHEAGHAVAARLLGHEVGGVTVNPGPGYQGLCWGVGHHEAFTNGRGDASNVREVLAPLMPKPGEDRVSVSDVFGNVHAQCLQLLAGRAAERMLLEGEPAMPADDLRQARELALLICSSEEAIETFIAHCDVAARDLLFPHGDAVIVLSTVLRIKRTLDGAEIDGLISDLQARKALAAERVRRKRWEGVIENAARLVAD
jgi:hypothetical protein